MLIRSLSYCFMHEEDFMTGQPTSTLACLSTLALACTAGHAAPDLFVAGAFLEDPQADPGDRVSIEYTVFNGGDDDADEPVVGYYLSDDQSISGDDVFIDSEEISDVDSGESEDESEQFTVPGVNNGVYYILIVADPFGAIPEESETNNSAALEITIGDGSEPCEPDFNQDGVLDLADVQAFTTAFLAGDPEADLTGDSVLDLADVQMFASGFLAGCP